MTVPFFWLHIRKAGGTSLRSVLGDHYVQTDRNFPAPFVAVPRVEWNDTLNNHRIPLGAYAFKRMLFTKKFLYDAEEFERMHKFAVVRNPYERAVSCWRYLTRRWNIGKPRHVLAHYRFESFLKLLPEIWEKRWDNHVMTHTAPIWPDITDENGVLLLDQILRLEKIDAELPDLCEKLEIPTSKMVHKNSTNTENYKKYYTKKALSLIEDLYKDDIENLNYKPY